ncbi:hypothetical protein RFI_00050 [Reticulomyxa filosa]|uniref:ADF-H domain-containing protein n=1 Tax=Reticulomyxa filosa TaxID=46433 RepID=X6PH44_RETFI|nr:hypothetical protein RFI_00050 [Reticulomyxa filosa]|eukprot:ETO37012.1 hypothetical protein RFI_00050 [Reticulomyxa filosa]
MTVFIVHLIHDFYYRHLFFVTFNIQKLASDYHPHIKKGKQLIRNLFKKVEDCCISTNFCLSIVFLICKTSVTFLAKMSGEFNSNEINDLQNEEPQTEEQQTEEPRTEEPQAEEPQTQEPDTTENSNQDATTQEIVEAPETKEQAAAPKPAKSKGKQTSSVPSGKVPENLNLDSAWKAISVDPPSVNWYLFGVDKKMELAFSKAGQQGLEEVTNVLKNASSELYFGLLRVNSNDKGGSKRAKFIFIRFVGSGVNVMQKAKITPKLGKIGDAFPVKHLTYDLTEDLGNFTIDSLAKEFLRVGGAHKPDSFDFGPDQVYVCN